MQKIIKKLCNRFKQYFHPSLEEGMKMVGIVEDMHCSSEELKRLEKMIKEYEEQISLNNTPES